MKILKIDRAKLCTSKCYDKETDKSCPIGWYWRKILKRNKFKSIDTQAPYDAIDKKVKTRLSGEARLSGEIWELNDRHFITGEGKIVKLFSKIGIELIYYGSYES